VSVEVVLQALDGNELGKVLVWGNVSWPVEDDRFPLLQYIDPYGDALFNGLQMDQIISKLQRLLGDASSDIQKQTLRDVMALALECQCSPHTFLRFLGD